jgi:hypothetical protein
MNEPSTFAQPARLAAHQLPRPRTDRSPTARELLNIAQKELESVKAFLAYDKSWPISARVQEDTSEDPRIASFKSGVGDSLSVLFPRLLCIRPLAEDYMKAFSDLRRGKGKIEQVPDKHTRRGGWIGFFIKERGLPPRNRTTMALRLGQKIIHIEREVDMPGISLVLLPVLCKCERLASSELKRLVELLRSGSYPELMETARMLSLKLVQYQLLYNRCIGNNPHHGQ